MLEFLKAPFSVLHFSYYTLMTFLMMLYVILLSKLMILLCIISVIRHLICDNRSDRICRSWLAKLNLICETLWNEVGSDLLISLLEELNWFRFNNLITLVLLLWKWIGLFLRKNHHLRCWGWLSLLNWIGALILSIAKTASKKNGELIRSVKLLSPEVALHLIMHGILLSCLDWCP